MSEECIAMHEEEDGCLVMTFKNRNYFIREAGPGANLRPGYAFVMGNSGRRRKPIMMITMPLGNVFHEIIDGTVSKDYHTLWLLPEDFRALKDLGYQSARKKFRTIIGGKPGPRR